MAAFEASRSSSHIIVRDRRGLRPSATDRPDRTRAIEAIAISPIVANVFVMFSYDRPDRKQTFWSDRGERDDRGDHMRTSLK